MSALVPAVCVACGASNLGRKFCETCGVAVARQVLDSPSEAINLVLPPAPNTGWQKAGKVAEGAGKLIDGTALVLMKAYAVVLIGAGLVLLFVLPGVGILPGLVLLAYGVYLITPGWKIVVW